jgi:hypothetical protein
LGKSYLAVVATDIIGWRSTSNTLSFVVTVDFGTGQCDNQEHKKRHNEFGVHFIIDWEYIVRLGFCNLAFYIANSGHNRWCFRLKIAVLWTFTSGSQSKYAQKMIKNVRTSIVLNFDCLFVALLNHFNNIQCVLSTCFLFSIFDFCYDSIKISLKVC